MGSKKGAGGRAGQAEVAGAQAGIEEIRRQFNVTQERFGETQAQLDPFVQAGTQALGGVQAAATPQGLEAIIGQILGGGAFQELVGERERAARGQLAAGGLTRSGTALQEIANIPTGLAFELENLLANRGANLAGSGQNAALGLGSLSGQLAGQGAQAAQGIAGLSQAQGVSRGAGILTNAQAQSQALQQGLGLASSIFFSDERLKDNIEVVAKLGGIDVIQWDWKEFTKGTVIEKCGTVGFSAQSVQEKYPQYVSEVCGWLAIDYPSLLDELEEQYAETA